MFFFYKIGHFEPQDSYPDPKPFGNAGSGSGSTYNKYGSATLV